MNAEVRLSIYNKYGEREEIKTFESTTIRGAKSKATRWLNNNIDYKPDELAKRSLANFSYWAIYPEEMQNNRWA